MAANRARTQVYPTAEQRRQVGQAAKARGVTPAEVVRDALDAHLADDPDPAAALAATFGAVPDAWAPARDTWGPARGPRRHRRLPSTT